VQEYFGVRNRRSIFKLTRLPMGAVISVFVANTLACVLHNDAVSGDDKITYMDNLVSSGDNKDTLKEVGRQTGATFGEIEVGTKMDVLGIRVDVVAKTVRLSQRFLAKHKTLLEEASTKEEFFTGLNHIEIWKILGVLFRFVEISRRPMADSFALMQRIRKIATMLALEKASWVDTAILHKPEYNQIRRLATEALRGEEFDVKDEGDDGPRAGDDVIFTDDSKEGLGYVSISNRDVVVGSWKLSTVESELPTHQLEAEALLRGLTQVPHCKRLIVLIDNQVLYHGITKGRSNALWVNRAAGAIAARSNSSWVGWIPSEENWTDGPSRLSPVETSAVFTHLTPSGSGIPYRTPPQ
jgi:hypothetical protein